MEIAVAVSTVVKNVAVAACACYLMHVAKRALVNTRDIRDSVSDIRKEFKSKSSMFKNRMLDALRDF